MLNNVVTYRSKVEQKQYFDCEPYQPITCFMSSSGDNLEYYVVVTANELGVLRIIDNNIVE